MVRFLLFWKFFCLFILSRQFYKEKVYKFQQFYSKMWMKKMLNEENQIHNVISSSGSGTVINYDSGSDFLTSSGSGSTSQKVTVPTVPVPQRWHTRALLVCQVSFYDILTSAVLVAREMILHSRSWGGGGGAYICLGDKDFLKIKSFVTNRLSVLPDASESMDVVPLVTNPICTHTQKSHTVQAVLVNKSKIANPNTVNTVDPLL